MQLLRQQFNGGPKMRHGTYETFLSTIDHVAIRFPYVVPYTEWSRKIVGLWPSQLETDLHREQQPRLKCSMID